MTRDELNKARKNYYNYYIELDKYKKELASLKDAAKKISFIEDLYNYVKNISLELYRKDEHFQENYCAISSGIFQCERLLPKEFIMNTTVDCNSTIVPPSENKQELILQYIVNEARMFLLSKDRYSNFPSLENINLVSECIPTSLFIENICKSINIECKVIKLFPAFTNVPTLFKESKKHYFVIVTIDDKDYLVDCTYAQFFRIDRCILNRLGIVRLSGCNCGIFMTIYEQRRKVAETILKNGWIELSDENMKAYLDGFTLSYRNGLYYEATNDFSYTTDYSADDYKRFLFTDDNQLNYEIKGHLGCQNKPLNNPTLSFKKR